MYIYIYTPDLILSTKNCPFPKGSSRFWGPVFGAHLSAAVSTSNSRDIQATFFSAWDSSILRGPRWLGMLHR